MNIELTKDDINLLYHSLRVYRKVLEEESELARIYTLVPLVEEMTRIDNIQKFLEKYV